MRDAACIHIGECEQRELMRLVPRLRAVMDDGRLNVSELYQPDTTIQMRARRASSSLPT